MIEFKNALKNENFKKLEEKLKEGVDVNDRAGEYRYPIHKAVLLGNIKIVELFLKNGADIDVQEPMGGNTAINLAVFNQDIKMVKFLKDMGADIRKQNAYGMAPLDQANYLKENMDIIEIDNIIEILK
ncbi:ankyrin repeat domain-containing protein [uncultured Cetobacterium sp.]|uniref:ankyrin repeat domain-containing protein n=1 Tax=uncultured Cetobacterium sp. TaxID=527638 RepID=UPI0026248573|nr:ankyrin repeat domain-containing protein [uncultured Cetobacterium sp.]